MPNSPSEEWRPSGAPRRVKMQRRGPLLVEGPVEVELEDGTTVYSDRFRVALCTCRRSRRYPWCDTSHRARSNGPSDDPPRTDG
ncbi:MULTISPECIES: CDGSH iron-sulfur domain-containing protein [Streptomyces]|uniref:CDGSH iron-sulfur domain-containing protein n=1 Tax=Streptomyces TaxID=1883 RepID=UPI0003A88834|nr:MULTISPECIES: CDGSH iron-sulfur domain-containing protein [Streptomyces]MBZ6109118.1 CDGSH iron-sulfur domain-containing protein [Streptomyces olivaceus]MBZ6123955.1 CDGSH iron-sulfur domain-containing protein [Streptomyces olivaceus]MBZ6144063.1 CDGSH iron-sulfur domain-containing protein [Streptomyces olivaceus]MBZ6157903.1 CDGSH iron-sulfur domain-containing protein [Streptomyces olivaceus]MBZ6185699.1 CDGSH iron-sulfur domain-containing protein [Streptomyces olivaceus]